MNKENCALKLVDEIICAFYVAIPRNKTTDIGDGLLSFPSKFETFRDHVSSRIYQIMFFRGVSRQSLRQTYSPRS